MAHRPPPAPRSPEADDRRLARRALIVRAARARTSEVREDRRFRVRLPDEAAPVFLGGVFGDDSEW